ncbi:MAG TPA: dephospho-CoA kinase [Micromonosporaceae bacterium]
MLMVGLTGGIGAGKSVVANRLADLGAVLIDSDQVARAVVAPGTEGLREIEAAFGPAVFRAGALDRAALGAVVFGDEEARRRLEAIVHPRVRARSAELAAQAPADAIVVNDVPLLVEVGLAPTYHLVIVVEAAVDVRIDRLVRARGLAPEQASARIRAQADDARRRAAADVLLVNDGPLEDLHAAVDTVWRDRLVSYERNLRGRHPVPSAPTVTLTEPDPTWPAQFERLAARIRYALGPPDRRVDHVGSTSVPLPAKDVIDMQLSVGSLEEADAFADRLAAAGFPRYPGEWWDAARYPAAAAERWPKRLHGSADPGRLVNLHVRVAGSAGWRSALLMRDHLRAEPNERAGYLALKRALAAESRETGVYADAKEPWFDEEHVRAERWAAATGWRP